MAAQSFTYVTKSPAEIRADYLRALKNGWISIGITSPNVGPGSPSFVAATALANEIAVGQANIALSVDGCMPDTAQGSNLNRWGAIIVRQRRGALPSHGNATVYTSSVAGTNFPVNAQLVDANGLRYQVVTGGIRTNQQTIGIASIDTGSATNHANGDTLTWVDQPAFAQPTVTVGSLGGTDGLVDGADSEVGNDELYRPRVLSAFAFPDKDGNEARVATLALQSSSQIGSAFVYPTLQGAGTVFVAVCAIPQTLGTLSSNSKSRAVPSSIVTGITLPFLQGALGGQPYIQAFSTVDAPVTMAVQLFLPASPNASPPGPGGGWLDALPWPSSVGATTTTIGTAPVKVTGISSSTILTVNATTAPIVGVSRIASLSTANWQLYTATVIGSTGTSGAYTLTLDTPFPYAQVGDVIWPQCANQAAYVAAILQAFANMGPGEWTSNASIIARAARRPTAAQQNPSALTGAWLKPLISAGPEVGDALFIYRGTSGGALTAPYMPAVPSTPTVGPKVFTPGPTGFYAI